MLPVDALRPGYLLNLEQTLQHFQFLLPLDEGSNGTRYNLDGLVSWSDSATPAVISAYTQLFRNAILESAGSGLAACRSKLVSMA